MTQEHAQPPSLWRRFHLAKVVKFIVITAVFGWVYGWAAPHCFFADERVGFGWGMLHGALMPMALPTLVMDKDVEIFASNNNGRLYKIGYIAGINLCGLVFFGSIFWSPGKKTVVQVESGAAG